MNAEYDEDAFEVDEGTDEAEDTEADEGWEADEADESDEAVYEADEADEADESDEAVPMGAAMEADESDEADEADEADESYGEARLSASARYRQVQARRRQEVYARGVAASQRSQALKAAASQRALASRIRAIPINKRPRISSVRTLQGAGVVRATLANGRTAQMKLMPPLAPISEVNRLRAVVITNEKRQASAIATNAKAVTSLASAQSAAIKRMTDQQVKSDRDIARKLVEGHNRLDARITKELSGGSGILDKHRKGMVGIMKRERRRMMMNNVLLATSVPFFLSFGDRKSPFTVDNAIITGSTLFWLLGDDVISGWAAKKGFAQGLSSVWSYGAPVLNGGGLFLLFRNKQVERFVAGITTIKAGQLSQPVDIKGLLKKKGKYGSNNFNANDHAVVASIVSANPPANSTVRAALDDKGLLTLTIDGAGSLPGPVDVAFIVDTAAPAEPVPV